MSSPSISGDNPQNNINKSNISTYGNNQIRNYSDNKMPPVKIPNNILTRSLRIRKSFSIGLFVLGAAAAAVTIASAVASLAFAVAFLPLIAIVGIGITSVALLTAGIILRLKEDTLSEENLPEVIKHLAKKDEDYIRNNNQLVNKVIEFCDKKKNVEDLEKNGLLPDIIKILAKSDKNYIKSNIGFVNKVIEFCDRDEVLGKLIDEKCDTSIESLTKILKNSGIDNAKGLIEKPELIKKNCELIKSISSLKGGEDVVNPEIKEENVKNATVQQKKNDTNILNEMTSFLENQENKNKLSELARKHKSGITAFQLSFDKGMISSITERSEKFLKQKTNSTKSIQDKNKNYTETHNADLDTIKQQSKSDFNRNACFLNREEIQGDAESRFNNLENKIKEEYQNNSDEIIKKILSFPGQYATDTNFIFNDIPEIENGNDGINQFSIENKIEITENGVYLHASFKFFIRDQNDGSYEPICIEESKKYRLNDQIEGNDQGEGKYTVPTLLAEHIAVFEAEPYITEEGNLAYLKIGEKKSEFNWINPKPEELVTLDVEKDAVNDKEK